MAALRLSHSGSLVPGLPPGKARRIGQSAVELVLDRLCGGEGQLLRRGDLNCRASGRIAAFASGAFLYLELAKAIERDFVALGRRTGDSSEHCVDNLTGVGLGQAPAIGNYGVGIN